MVGDVLDKDIYPAQKAGLKTVWFNPNGEAVPDNVTSISKLEELI